MGNISVSLPSDGDTIDVADYNTPITTIVNEFNGNMDNSNLSASAAIAGSKLADSAITTAKVADSAITPAKMLGVDLFAVTTAQSGTSPTAGSGQFYMIAASVTGTFASNALDINFPTAFPNGLSTVVITNGDNNTGEGISVNNGSTSKTGFRAQCGTNGSKRVNYIAIGF